MVNVLIFNLHNRIPFPSWTSFWSTGRSLGRPVHPSTRTVPCAAVRSSIRRRPCPGRSRGGVPDLRQGGKGRGQRRIPLGPGAAAAPLPLCVRGCPTGVGIVAPGRPQSAAPRRPSTSRRGGSPTPSASPPGPTFPWRPPTTSTSSSPVCPPVPSVAPPALTHGAGMKGQAVGLASVDATA